MQNTLENVDRKVNRLMHINCVVNGNRIIEESMVQRNRDAEKWKEN